MLWAGSGGGVGFPGTVSSGPGGLQVTLDYQTLVLTMASGGGVQLNDSHGHQLLALVDGLFSEGLFIENGLGLFGHNPATAPTTGGAHTAGGTYTAVEQGMLEACYTALQSIGVVT